MSIKVENNKKMPGEFQIGDSVRVTFGQAGHIKNCNVIKAHFANGGHESYDLAVLMYQDDDGTSNYSRLYNVPRGLMDLANHEYVSEESSILPNYNFKECPDCGASLRVELKTGELEFVKHNA